MKLLREKAGAAGSLSAMTGGEMTGGTHRLGRPTLFIEGRKAHSHYTTQPGHVEGSDTQEQIFSTQFPDGVNSVISAN